LRKLLSGLVELLQVNMRQTEERQPLHIDLRVRTAGETLAERAQDLLVHSAPRRRFGLENSESRSPIGASSLKPRSKLSGDGLAGLKLSVLKQKP